MALGIDDHEAVPANCGRDKLSGATSGILDVETGHCYSVVAFPTAANRDFAGNECTRLGGYLACVSDPRELHLLTERVVPTDAWLGMRLTDGDPASRCDNGETVDVSVPIWSGNPGAGCSALGAAAVDPVGCASTANNMICEFELVAP
jgi:hypothetical protein